MDLRNHQRVKISAEGIGSVVGRVEDICTPAAIPELPIVLPEMRDEVVTVLAEWGVSRVAMISYYADAHVQYLFTALEIAGEWWDLKRQRLTLEVIGQFPS